MPTPLLVLDFDGTVCLGDAPVEAYAREVERRLSQPAARRVGETFDRYREGLSPDPDGYFAVARAVGDELSAQQFTEAYLASRDWLARHPDSVRVPAELAEFLAGIGDRGVTRVLLTNSPRHGVEQVLAAHGLGSSFDEVIGDARKPGTWSERLSQWLECRPGTHLLSVGDVWDNDCRPVLAAGGCAAFIDTFGLASGPATMTASTFPDLYGEILAWADDPAGYCAAHPTP